MLHMVTTPNTYTAHARTRWRHRLLTRALLKHQAALIAKIGKTCHVSGTEETQSSEAWFCASVQPQKQDCVKLHPCNSPQHLRKQGPRGFLRVFFAAALAWLLPVRCAFGAITCKVKYKQSTSELCRERQWSRVSERNPNGNLTTTPSYFAKTPTQNAGRRNGSTLLQSKSSALWTSIPI